MFPFAIPCKARGIQSKQLNFLLIHKAPVTRIKKGFMSFNQTCLTGLMPRKPRLVGEELHISVGAYSCAMNSRLKAAPTISLSLCQRRLP